MHKFAFHSTYVIVAPSLVNAEHIRILIHKPDALFKRDIFKAARPWAEKFAPWILDAEAVL